jgi:hypothetical protein
LRGRTGRNLLTEIALIPQQAPVGAVVCVSKERILMPERYDKRTIETGVEARQGVTGHNVRYVLAFGICGVIAAFIIIYFLFFR